MLSKYKIGLFWLSCFLFLEGISGCTNPVRRNSTAFADSLLTVALQNVDTTSYCYQFKELHTAEEYYRSANTRSKACMFDNLAQLVALKEYAYAVNLDPKHWYAHRNYARQLLRIHQYARALQELNAIDSIFLADDPDVYAMRGEAYYGVKDYRAAISEFDKALTSYPTSSFILLYKAKAEWKLGEFEQACLHYKKAQAQGTLSKQEKEFLECD